MGKNILVVDDDHDTCSNLADILGDLGYEIDVAYEGDEAIDLARSKDYGLALLDYRLPCMTGVELFHRLRSERARLPAIIISGYLTTEAEEEAAREGIPVLAKPVDFGRLIGHISGVLGAAN
jgi:DNA-binding NtrC family response regulator